MVDLAPELASGQAPTPSEVPSEAGSQVQVEVTVQDYYFAGTADQIEDLERETPESEEPEKAFQTSSQTSPAPITPQQWEAWFGCWLNTLQPQLVEPQVYELSLRLTDDAEIQSFNAQYRQKDQPTDVLAFAALEVDLPQAEAFPLESPLYLGDIVISVETAQVQAQQQNHSLQQELAWLAAHALLHLLGWDHPDEAHLQEMLLQQEHLLQTIGMTSGYHRGDSEPT